MGLMVLLFGIFISTFFLTKMGGEWMFMIWVCCMYACIGGAFALLPTYTDDCFGHKYFGSNYGMVFTSVSKWWMYIEWIIVLSSLMSAFFVTIMVKKIGVTGISM